MMKQILIQFRCATILGVYLIFFTTCLFAQSNTVIYNKDGQPLDVSDLTIKPLHIEYVSPNVLTNESFSILKEDVLLIFHPLGQFYVYDPSLNDLEPVPYIEGYNGTVDKIITKSTEVRVGEILEMSPSQIKYSDATTGNEVVIPKNEIRVVLHRNGDYNLYGDIIDVANALLVVKYKIIALGMHNTTADEIIENKTVNLEYPENNASPESNASIDASLASVDKEEFKRKALFKTQQLEDYLHFIAGKRTDKFKANQAIESAVELFLSENNIVQVSSKDKVTNELVIYKRRIREYLTRLKLLKYDNVRISWSDISYVSDIRLNEDGNYFGTIVIKQKFEGYIDGQLKYTDITTKNMTVILKTYQKYVAGEKQTLWDVFLGDIGVVDTV